MKQAIQTIISTLLTLAFFGAGMFVCYAGCRALYNEFTTPEPEPIASTFDEQQFRILHKMNVMESKMDLIILKTINLNDKLDSVAMEGK